MDAGNDLKFVIGAIIVLGILWILSGGPGSSGSSGFFIQTPDKNENISKGDPSDGIIDNEVETIGENLDQIEVELERAKSKFEASAFKGFVEINSFSKAKKTDPDEEYVRLRISKNLSENMSITGWKLESPLTGVAVTIGEGSYLPYSARVNPEQAIFVKPGEDIYVVTGRSPIGTSFRTNLCTGYFEQFQDFEPRLPKDCPKPIDDLFRLAQVSGGAQGDACVEFVKDLDRCELYRFSVPQNIGGSCQSYVTEKVNYNTCVDLHKNDKNFQGDEWRVYLGRTEQIWKERREIIKPTGSASLSRISITIRSGCVSCTFCKASWPETKPWTE